MPVLLHIVIVSPMQWHLQISMIGGFHVRTLSTRASLAAVALLLPATAAAQLAPQYAVQRLGTLPGDTGSIAYGICENGIIAGASRDAGGNNTLSGFMWQAGTMTDLGR